ncbi:ANTAR domain-containing response regulator [Neobacillus ginsengisoli]|uniref:Response regulator NasT n=1 Tax=Neobacillus ginsengisoli TaxID=904295 RepID=A0ABT9XVA1_9BACI|nr:response regulator [Neobacillus ginsengisoli]MDQ0199490.1 response regulator NasT [Neobacillus ginsengisoli]
MGKSRIMVVEDESILRMDIKEMLKEAGFDVVAEANSGDTAIELAALHKPDLIVMDVKMPKMNGIKAGRIIYQAYQIPVLLLTAYSERDLVEEAKNAHILGYLVKPISERDLIPAVEIAMAQANRLKALTNDIKKMEEKIEDQKTIQRAKGILMEVYQVSEEQAFKMLRSYSMNHGKTLKSVADYIILHRELDSNASVG